MTFPSKSKKPFLPCIMGPTGAGKSAVALQLAAACAASVINADSRQIYRDFPLITAQPTPGEQALCPHRLYGFLPTSETLGAGAFAELASGLIAEDNAKGLLPLLVGGTGLYFKTLLEGIAPIPPVPPELSAAWRRRMDAEGPEKLHALLTGLDPHYAAKIHPRDRQRIARALEVREATGKRLSWWHERPLPPRPWRVCKTAIYLPLEELSPLLAKRIDLMLEAGALDEARAALEACGDPRAPGWSGIGCGEIFRHLAGEISLDECRALWLKNTRAYAKRQMTWFRADKDIRWFRTEESPLAAAYILDRARME